jgi:hypothetical protein
LRRAGYLWTLSTVVLVVPFLGVAVGLSVAKPLLIPIGVIALAHAWIIPELYAARGAGVLRRRRRARAGRAGSRSAERTALGLLADLLDHPARELAQRTGLALEPGRFGAWLIGEAGAVLVRPGGRRLDCYCVTVPEPELPSADRVAHLLLALREDEAGFATIANLAFSGAPWRLRRRLGPPARDALSVAVGAAR